MTRPGALIAENHDKVALVVNFSGGKDSTDA
jgi:hypothetical protein